MAWSNADIPDQTGRRAVVTGATSGLGYETARVLAAHGADVVVTSRGAARAEAAAAELTRITGAKVDGLSLDLGDLDSVGHAADAVLAGGPLDLLINNAGIMATPRRLSPQGFESQLAVNHLGHVALTARLLAHLRPGGRVVTVSSGLHRVARTDFDDPASERRYSPFRAYGRSKLANLLFAFELDRRLRAAGATVASLAAHPGHAESGLRDHMGPVSRAVGHVMGALIGHSTADGALPQLRAATDPAATGGEFYGPGGRAGMRGAPVIVGSSTAARDATLAAQVWDRTLELAGVQLELTPRH
ncbi:SDR family NAD(P)-dependent oxidoreductase [Cellulomonas sp. APG4]|uniref:oxidoreductase n=1 Tax=Cellulomonas sp. APG4 TaxID=1538656 RepID=UPI0013794119|nr:oxidoreductase [Cellulomonas sp. APG4]NCT89593.1 SDR family NAD(P)-dependent oxidoreductase [Cellulomonas sp. APG4]